MNTCIPGKLVSVVSEDIKLNLNLMRGIGSLTRVDQEPNRSSRVFVCATKQREVVIHITFRPNIKLNKTPSGSAQQALSLLVHNVVPT